MYNDPFQVWFNEGLRIMDESSANKLVPPKKQGKIYHGGQSQVRGNTGESEIIVEFR